LRNAEEKLILEVQEMTIIALEKISTSKDDSNKSGSEEESVDTHCTAVRVKIKNSD